MEENLVLIGDNIVRGVKTVAFKTFRLIQVHIHFCIIYTHTSLHMFGFNPIVNEIQVFNQKSAFVDTLDTYMVQISITFF